MTAINRIICVALAAMGGLAADAALAQEFRGKTIRIVVGSAPGGGYDANARLVARHLGAHIAGNPTVIVSNMPGASGAQAANYLYLQAPKDGTVLGTFNKSLPTYQAVGQAGVRFKAEELSWLGCLSQTVDTVVMWHTAPTIAPPIFKACLIGEQGWLVVSKLTRGEIAIGPMPKAVALAEFGHAAAHQPAFANVHGPSI